MVDKVDKVDTFLRVLLILEFRIGTFKKVSTLSTLSTIVCTTPPPKNQLADHLVDFQSSPG